MLTNDAMILETSIREIMTENVVTISSSDNIWDIERIFRINHLRHAPVLENGDLVGMISLIDLRRTNPTEDDEDISNQEMQRQTAAQIMAPDPVALQSDQPLKDAALVFSENEFHAVPVMERGHLVGILSTTDIIRFLIDAIDELEEI